MKMLKEEANRCLICKQNCPVNTEIPEIVQLFKNNKIDKAGKLLFDNNPLSAICAIVCPHEKQCSGNCVRGEPIAFYKIEEYISKSFLETVEFKKGNSSNDRIAIVGSGPAGITIAFILTSKVYNITIFEAHERIGGVLRYGIPNFRLPKEIIYKLQEKLLQLDVKIRPKTFKY